MLFTAAGLTMMTAVSAWWPAGGAYGAGAALVIASLGLAGLFAGRAVAREPTRRSSCAIIVLELVYLFWQSARIGDGDPFGLLGIVFPIVILATLGLARRGTGGRGGRLRPSPADRGEGAVSFIAVAALLSLLVAVAVVAVPDGVGSGLRQAVCATSGQRDCTTDPSAAGVETPAAGAAGPASDRPGAHRPPDGNCWNWLDWLCATVDGLRLGSWDTLKGLWDGVTFTTCLVHVCSHPAFKDGWAGLGDLVAHPIDSAQAIWDDTAKPVRDDWNGEHKVRAVARTVPTALGIVFGGKGINKLGKLKNTKRPSEREEISGRDGDGGAGDIGELVSRPERALLDEAERVPWRERPETVKELEIEGPPRAFLAFRVELGNDSHALYKADTDGPATWKSPHLLPVGGLSGREVAFSRLDETLGFDIVPTTTKWNGPRGPGSLQEWVDDTSAGRLPHFYSDFDRDALAVLDYVGGHTDRHRRGNLLTSKDGRVVGIDNGHTFPESTVRPLLSDFVVDRWNRPLSDEVMAKVRSVDVERLRARLLASGLGAKAVDWSLARLKEVRTKGMITGEAWPGAVHPGSGPPD
ncbi:hypothetical protein GCM10023085_19340 [Actinomadura viridis]|uniref:PI3K/PI4K catalytic domain-containing protein n=1 Tax=Actinomadura viridis TaxID=58110 RepID=A0A931DLL5_9ACTN|nr:hypothetical protein [Actinomadura viridis]MBG6089310.1 hypothetical protein [Actinomadura viridis]